MLKSLCLCLFPLADGSESLEIFPGTVIEGSNVTLTCRATRYLYSGVHWFAFNQSVPGREELDRLSTSVSIVLLNVSRNLTDDYHCRALNLFTRKEIQKSAALFINGRSQSFTKWISLKKCVYYCYKKNAKSIANLKLK